MNCKKCGAEIPENSIFCSKCGQVVSKEPNVAPAETEQILQQSKEAHDVGKSSGKKPFSKMIILLTVFVAAAVLVGLFFLIRPFSRKTLVLYEAITYDRNGEVMARNTLDEGSTLCERNYSTKDNNGDVVGRTEEQYNDKGKLLSRVQYGADGNIGSKTVYTYTNDKTKSILELYNANGEVIYYTETTYDTKGRLLERLIKESDGSMNHIKISYREDGKEPISYMDLNDEGAVISRTEFEYNRKGKKTSESIYDQSENLISRVEYFYGDKDELVREKKTDSSGETEEYVYQSEFDSNERLSDQKKYDSKGSLVSRFVYEYPNQGGGYEVTSYDADGKKEETTGYDQEGNTIKTCRYSYGGGQETVVSMMEYDSYGRQTKLLTAAEWIELVYDEAGNQIRETRKDPESGEILQRTEYAYREMN